MNLDKDEVIFGLLVFIFLIAVAVIEKRACDEEILRLRGLLTKNMIDFQDY